jgi:hypothetical protein
MAPQLYALQKLEILIWENEYITINILGPINIELFMGVIVAPSTI